MPPQEAPADASNIYDTINQMRCPGFVDALPLTLRQGSREGTRIKSDAFSWDAEHQITVRGYSLREVSRRLGVLTRSLYRGMKLFVGPDL